MNNGARPAGAGRLIAFILAVILHAALLLFAVVGIKTTIEDRETRADIMRLADIRERPEPPAPAPPSAERPPLPVSAADTAAVTVIDSDVDARPPAPGETAVTGGTAPAETVEFLPMHLVSERPRFSEAELKRRTVYPPIAQRAGVEGTVYLEIFVDSAGAVQAVTILKEDPPDRGFGEAAARAFRGLTGEPARANGVPVACRYRYPVRFELTRNSP
jgi:protein TonB